MQKVQTAYFKITSRKSGHLHTEEMFLNLFFLTTEEWKAYTEREPPVPN